VRSATSINRKARTRDELAENPERAFGGNGNICKYEARIAELERLLGQAHAENKLFKKKRLFAISCGYPQDIDSQSMIQSLAMSQALGVIGIDPIINSGILAMGR